MILYFLLPVIIPDEEKSAGHQRQFTEAELLYANKAADEAEAAGKIRGSKSGYRQGILNRIAAGEVDRNEIDMLAINVEADRLAGKFRKFIKTIPGMDPAEKDELLKQLAAETYEIKMDGERIEYTADIVGNELKGINAVDDYMRFDDIRDEVEGQNKQEAMTTYLDNVKNWSADQARRFIQEYCSGEFGATVCIKSQNGELVDFHSDKVLERIRQHHPGVYAEMETASDVYHDNEPGF